MTTQEMLLIVREQLAIDLNCSVSDLDGGADGFVFAAAKDNPGRRPFRRGKQFLEMLTMGRSVVVSATPARLAYAKEQLAEKGRDDAFAMPFVSGHVLCYLPDIENMRCVAQPPGFVYETVPEENIAMLREIEGFNNAVQYDTEHPVRNTLAILAKQGGETAGIAGAFWWSSKMWGIGIDVCPAYRRRGLAAYLVNALTIKLLLRDIVPVYATTSSNIASQRVGYRAGYMPAWMSDWRVRFEMELSN